MPKRAPPKQPKTYPQAEALYDYTASDTDEISLNAGEKLSVLKEGKFNILPNITTIREFLFDQDLLKKIIISDFILDESGWWTGRLSNGKEGFFPGAYVRKL